MTDTKQQYCTTGKVKHKSQLAAEHAMNEMLRSVDVKNKDILQVYPCDICGSLHVGRKRK